MVHVEAVRGQLIARAVLLAVSPKGGTRPTAVLKGSTHSVPVPVPTPLKFTSPLDKEFMVNCLRLIGTGTVYKIFLNSHVQAAYCDLA